MGVTSFYQIWVGTFQKQYEANSMQLLFYQAPLSVLFLSLGWPLFENTPAFWDYTRFYDTELHIILLCSCLAAFFVNWTTYHTWKFCWMFSCSCRIILVHKN